MEDWELSIINRATEIMRYHVREKGLCITSPESAKTMAMLELAGKEHEVFCVIWLDTKCKIIEFEHMFRGTINMSGVYPREVVKSALEHNAESCILVHNHPSGSAEPSGADQAITKRLKAALALIDVRVLDHFVVGDIEVVSFSQRGLM